MAIWSGIGLFVAGFALKSPLAGFAGLALITFALIRKPGSGCETDIKKPGDRPETKAGKR